MDQEQFEHLCRKIGESKWLVLGAIADMKETVVANLNDLKALDAEIAGDLTDAVNTIITDITQLEQKLAAGQDFTAEIQNIKNVATALRTAAQGANPSGPLAVDNPTLSLSLASAPTGAFNASDPNFAGPITAQSNDPTVATVAPASGNGPGPVAFTVTAVAVGTTRIAVSDGTTTLEVAVAVAA